MLRNSNGNLSSRWALPPLTWVADMMISRRMDGRCKQGALDARGIWQVHGIYWQARFLKRYLVTDIFTTETRQSMDPRLFSGVFTTRFDLRGVPVTT